jgi:signal transduction histidine kinase/ActR/RegA family two-component response regulator
VAATISQMTTRLLAKPLGLLQEGIQSVMEGRLEPIEVSRTGDEIELLGDSFNSMVAALDASKKELLEHQEKLEERIKQRTRELEAAMQNAMAASEAKSEFLANMSHELRTPMNGLLGMIDIVLTTPMTAEQRDHLVTARSCAYALLALLNDVLDLSKIEARRMALEVLPFDPHELIADTVRSHVLLAQSKGVKLVWSIAPSVPHRIEADPLRVRQILANLLSNAVKFTDRGSIHLEASAASAGAGKIMLEISVRDTGLGIAADKLGEIFEKFTQADGSTTRRYGGTGLGLAIAKQLVELHGGTIRVESREGEGSTFSVSLPCREVEPRESCPSAVESRPRILVVDDNAVNRKMVSGILAKGGYEIAMATQGLEAIDVLERQGADLVLMDIQMPVQDGLETTRQIRRKSRWSRLPVIAMTAHAMDGDRENCLAAGMSGYISKPVHAGHLLHTVERLLDETRLSVA